MRTYALTIAYDGRDYAGWQCQKNGLAVQQVLEECLGRMFGEKITLHGSGRTDSGVHALGQIASFQQQNQKPDIEVRRMRLALNAILPPAIRILRVRRVKDQFHARFQARGKEYHYYIFNGEVLPPHLAGRVWFVHDPLDLRNMRQAARHLEGKHDFTSFVVNPGYEVGSKVRTITKVQVGVVKTPSGPGWVPGYGTLLAVRVAGSGFMYKMVRSIAGTLVAVGRGKMTPAEVARVLKARDRRLAHMTAPAGGLYLMRVKYGK
ncbi:MAG: tRNA pseudouridine(38-40) synthase TruA [Verrucomicrobiae bacterium]|nr:tRNA pseudouridine(38-40) synthase TruA [Verrucomicrobiae bacterium]